MLLQGTDSLNRATQSIERSHRIAAETDQIGSEIIEELGEQRDQLERTKSRLVNTSENLSKSRKILRSMSRKVTTNKLLLSIVILLELAILGGLVYYKFFLKYWTSYREVFVDQNFDPEWMVLETWWWLHSNMNVLGVTEL